LYRRTAKPGLWKEIRKRRLFPFLGLFLASGFLALEWVDQLTGHGAVPEEVYWVSLIIYLFGIPGTIILAWFHGECGPQKPRRIEVFLHGALVIGAIVACWSLL
jgi:hypothetical protein